MEARQIMQATDDQLQSTGAVFYFHPDTVAVGKEHGLGGFRFYILGRGGVLGNVEAEVVRSAFGYFDSGLIKKLWDSSCEIMAPREGARLYIQCAHELGRKLFADLDGLDGFIDAAGQVIGAVEGASLPLFAGVRAEPVPTDAPAAAIHQAMVLRELRGSVHLLALTATGLNTAVAHAVKRPDDVEMFGYSEAPAVDDADREARDRAEVLTNDLLAPAYASLSAAQAEALIAGSSAMYAAIQR